VKKALNLASGTDLRPPPWENWDIVKRWPTNSRDADRVWDARSDRIDEPDNSVSEICAGYLLLHVSREHHVPLVREMFRVLEPGGRLVVDEVDMAKAMRRWLVNPYDQSANDICFGEQGNVHGEEFAQYDKHCSGLTDGMLIKLLTDAGFSRVNRISLHAPSVWYSMVYEAFKP
jgi:hypothetical protein